MGEGGGGGWGERGEAPLSPPTIQCVEVNEILGRKWYFHTRGGGGGGGAGEATGLKLSSGGLDSATESNPGLFKIYSIQYHTL